MTRTVTSEDLLGEVCFEQFFGDNAFHEVGHHCPGQPVFPQLMEPLPRHEFSKRVARYDGNRRERRFRRQDQFLVLAFAQLTFRKSLRDIKTCLRAMDAKPHHARLYHCRWEVELLFKWIKRHLRIKAFFGTSMNAVQTQLWMAISVYVLVAITKRYLNTSRSMGEIPRILSLSLFEKTPVSQLLDASKRTLSESDDRNSSPLLEF